MSAAVIYAAKSNRDKYASIPTQIADGNALAAREGLEVAGEYHDEAASAYTGNRGAGLQRALAHAEREGAALIVQHSDRLARGDGDQARHLVELVLWARKAGVTLRSVQDPQTFDGMGLVYAALMGDRNHEDSARKSKAVRAGLKRRKERGKPVGPVPVGYSWEHRPEGNTVRVLDPDSVPIVELIFDVVEAGGSLGDAARQLNALGYTGKRGGPFQARTVRDIIGNLAYSGEKGYPVLIDPERQHRVLASLRRMDPAAVQRRRGGSPPRADQRYFLRGLAFCLHCGGALWTRELAAGRTYLCRNVRLATGTCSAAGIHAELIERHVLTHIETFVGSAERWLAERRDEHRRDLEAQQDAVRRLTKALDDLDRQREKLMASYRQQVADGRSTAPLALEAVEQLDAERAEQEQRLADAEAIAAEHDTDEDEAHTTALVSSFRERIADADSAPALNAALAGSLTGLWASVEDGRLLVEFELADSTEINLPGGITPKFDRRSTLPPRHLDDRTIEPPELPKEGRVLPVEAFDRARATDARCHR